MGQTEKEKAQGIAFKKAEMYRLAKESSAVPFFEESIIQPVCLNCQALIQIKHNCDLAMFKAR